MATGITILSAALCATLVQLFFGGILSFIFRALTQESMVGLGASFGFFVAATLFKVQDEY